MVTLNLFELACPRCGLTYPQLLPDDGERVTSLPCPNDAEPMVKARRLGPESGHAACAWTPAGGG